MGFPFFFEGKPPYRDYSPLFLTNPPSKLRITSSGRRLEVSELGLRLHTAYFFLRSTLLATRESPSKWVGVWGSDVQRFRVGCRACGSIWSLRIEKHGSLDGSCGRFLSGLGRCVGPQISKQTSMNHS